MKREAGRSGTSRLAFFWALASFFLFLPVHSGGRARNAVAVGLEIPAFSNWNELYGPACSELHFSSNTLSSFFRLGKPLRDHLPFAGVSFLMVMSRPTTQCGYRLRGHTGAIYTVAGYQAMHRAEAHGQCWKNDAPYTGTDSSIAPLRPKPSKVMLTSNTTASSRTMPRKGPYACPTWLRDYIQSYHMQEARYCSIFTQQLCL